MAYAAQADIMEKENIDFAAVKDAGIKDPKKKEAYHAKHGAECGTVVLKSQTAK